MQHVYKIADNGIGMTPEFQKLMFNAFEQENADSSIQGTGLGLYIVKQFVDALGGTIVCKSEKGHGTTFTVSMEYDIVSEEYAKASSRSEEKWTYDESLLKGKRILLCDDHPINLQIATKILKKVGAEVDTGADGKIGLELYKEKPNFYYSAVITDIRMPVMDGIQLTKAIRSEDRPDAKTIPILAMTADAFDRDKNVGFEVGLTDYVTKPIAMDKLLQILSQADWNLICV